MTKEQKHSEENSTASAVKNLNIDPAKIEEAKLLEHPSYIELANKLEEAEETSAKHWERILRMQAEAENIERRNKRDLESAHKFALEKFVSELLPVIDNLERALTHSSEDLEGVALTLKSFISAIKKFGVEQIDPVSTPFNPEYHQAVATQEVEGIKPGNVVEVMQKGYLLNGRLVRPALVVVSK